MFVDSLDYKKYHISIYKDVDYKNAYYCQVYLVEDINHDNCIDDFCIFEEQMKNKTLEEAIINRMEYYIEWVEKELK